MTQPRTSPLQKVPSRNARSKYALGSRHAAYSSNKSPVNIPKYVTATFPGEPLNVRKAMVAAIERYVKANPDYELPSPVMLKNPQGILTGLIG